MSCRCKNKKHSWTDCEEFKRAKRDEVHHIIEPDPNEPGGWRCQYCCHRFVAHAVYEAARVDEADLDRMIDERRQAQDAEAVHNYRLGSFGWMQQEAA